MLEIDLEQANAQLRDKSAEEIVQWAMNLPGKAFSTTSFSKNAAVMLKLSTDANPEMPIVWVDSGYNMRDAYLVAEKLIERLKPNLQVYVPDMTAERRNAIMGGVPHPDDNLPLFEEFVRQVKLGPFQRAISEIAPDIWLTGIRREETDFRKGLDIVSYDNRGLLRVAPLFYWSEQDVLDYMTKHDLPSPKHYFDPTKISENVECGLHTAA